MAHVELSLSESFVPEPRRPVDDSPVSGVRLWAARVTEAAEPCLVIDADQRIVAMSRACSTLLGLRDPEATVGRELLDGVLRLVDFTAARTELTGKDVQKIPPLLALESGRLARGLMRVHDGTEDGFDVTVDAIATPLWDGTHPAGSLTFFSAI